MQASWILAIPAFRAIDEFDHVHRAASVANGHWGPAQVPAAQGRGRLVASTPALVEAAERQCEFYAYTKPDNCHVVQELEDGSALIASAATEQPSAYYALVGYAASTTDGTAAVYVMRSVGAILCTLLIVLALWATNRWATGPLALVGLAMALTPIAVYSTVVPSGNGLELVAAIALWSSLIGLGTRKGRTHERALLLGATAPMALLCGLRQLGPGIAVVIVGIALVLLGARGAREVVTRNPRTVAWLVVVATTSTICQASWVIAAGRFAVGPTDPAMAPSATDPSPFGVYVIQWFLGSFAAFPTRNEPAPPVVYAVLVLASVALVTWGWLRASGRARAAITLTVIVCALGPIVFTLAYWDPAKWQGRYSLPVTVGCFLLAGLALESRRPRAGTVVLCAGAIGAMHVVSVVGVTRFTDPPIEILLPAALMTLGWAAVAVAFAIHATQVRDRSAQGEVVDP